jgi:hypothetical protein
MRAVCQVYVVCAALMVGAGAIAQEPVPGNTPATAPSIQRFGDTDKTCVAWTDGCRLCRRDTDNAVNCSNIGIACQPGGITCTSTQSPAKEPVR